jgi:predicted phage terminase large subunit-like protein
VDKAEIIEEAKKNLVNFRKILLTTAEDEKSSPEFHYKWSDLLLQGQNNTAIEGFRESGKSSYILRAFPLYCIAYPEKARSYIVIIKANARLAQSKLKEIERECLNNPVIKERIVKIVDQSAERFSIDVHYTPEKTTNLLFEAYGKGASIRGLSNQDRRPSIVVIDDPQSIEDARSEAVTEADWQWFTSDVMFLGKKSRIFLIGNNLGERSIIERVFANPKELGFETYKTSVLHKGKSSWEEMFPVEEIEKEKENYRKIGELSTWLREKMCEAISEETRIFKKQDYRYFAWNTVDKIIRHTRVKATLDPASSTDNKSCYRAIVVNAVDTQNNWFIVDVPFGRWDSALLIEKIFDTVTKWELRDFGIEKGIFKQVLEPFIYKEMSQRQVFFNIIPIEHGKRGTKLERIKLLQPRFKAHTIWFPDNADWVAEMESELAGVTKDEIKSLYIDLVDALAMQEQVAERPHFRGKKVKDLPRQTEDNYQLI